MNRAEQAAYGFILWEQGVAGSNPAVPTTHTKPELSRGPGTPSLGDFEQVASSQPLTEILTEWTHSKFTPVCGPLQASSRRRPPRIRRGSSRP